MSDVAGPCEYVLDPDDHETWGGQDKVVCNVADEILNADGVWTCPYDAERGKKRCVFHLPAEEKDDNAAVDALLDRLDKVDRGDDTQNRRFEFLGATFGEFDVSDTTVDPAGENESIVLAHSDVTGRLDWSGSAITAATIDLTGIRCAGDANFGDATFHGDADFREATFEDTADFGGATFGGEVDFRGATFEDDCEFRDVTVENDADFGGTTFQRNAYFRDTSFENDARFNRCTCEGDADFSHTTYEGETEFKRTTFGGDVGFRGANFRLATFESDADFGGTTFQRNAYFRRTTFESEASLGGATFESDVDFVDSTFEDALNFGYATFGGEADLQGATFDGDVDFGDATFHGDAVFTDATFGGGIDFSEVAFDSQALFDGLNLDGAQFDEADLTDATFTETTLRDADLESALLSRATLFGANFRGARVAGTVLGDVRIDAETKFLGHHEADSGFSPHTLSAIRSRPKCVYDPGYAEDSEYADVGSAKSVYRALEELGRKHARPRLQARSFVRRQDLQKQEYWDDATADDASLEERLIAGARWSRAKVARATLLYGESPWRVLGYSLGIIFGFALLFPLGGWMKPEGGDPITYAQITSNPAEFLNSVYYSTLTFTALGFGDFKPVGLGRALTTIETGFGAVLLALLVFILGRRAAR